VLLLICNLYFKDFKYVRYIEVCPNPDEKPIYRYSDNSNQNNLLARLGGNIEDSTSKGKIGYFEVGIDYRPMLRANNIFNSIMCVGVISFVVYIVLLIRFRFKLKKYLIDKHV